MVWLKTLLFTVLVPGTVTVYLPALLLSLRTGAEAPGRLCYLGLLPLLVGVFAYFACAFSFSKSGRGTPAPYDPPKELVVSGPYRWVRNPMYIGVLCVLFGEAVLFQSWLLLSYAALIVLRFYLRVVYYEEPTLNRLFGHSFTVYCANVPRWFPFRHRRIAPLATQN